MTMWCVYPLSSYSKIIFFIFFSSSNFVISFLLQKILSDVDNFLPVLKSHYKKQKQNKKYKIIFNFPSPPLKLYILVFIYDCGSYLLFHSTIVKSFCVFLFSLNFLLFFCFFSSSAPLLLLFCFDVGIISYSS